MDQVMGPLPLIWINFNSTLLGVDVATTKIRDHLKEMSGKLLTSKDSHNMRQKLTGSPDSTEDKLIEVLQKWAETDQELSVVIMVDDDEELELLYIQSGRMKKVHFTYPVVLIMDSTYQVNNRELPLSSILVMDGNGEGRVVAHAILKNEWQETLRHFLVQFKEQNPCVCDSRAFLVDKDFNETALLKEILP